MKYMNNMLAALVLTALATSSCGETARTPKVLMIGIDGCRPDALLDAGAPAIDALIAEGALSVQAQTGARTSSGPSCASPCSSSRARKRPRFSSMFVIIP